MRNLETRLVKLECANPAQGDLIKVIFRQIVQPSDNLRRLLGIKERGGDRQLMRNDDEDVDAFRTRASEWAESLYDGEVLGFVDVLEPVN
jgi:hypothetical protein